MSNDSQIIPDGMYIVGVKGETDISKFNIVAKFANDPTYLLEGHAYTDYILES